MNPYAVLGIEPGATQDEIRLAYRRAARTHHPDRGGTAERFQAAKEAYDDLIGRVCDTCGGTGLIMRRQGLFIRKEACPICQQIG